jgi:hypothetical protein
MRIRALEEKSDRYLRDLSPQVISTYNQQSKGSLDGRRAPFPFQVLGKPLRLSGDDLWFTFTPAGAEADIWMPHPQP